MLNIFKKLLNSQSLFKAVIFIIIIAVFFVNARSAMALDVVSNVILGGVGAAVAQVLALIALILTSVIGLLITVVVALLIQVAQYGNIINVPTVIQGWVIIRDLCNMSFILILLIIAFATILRQEDFSAKKLLPKLLIMAVLINFSRTIFGLMIDVSQIIMLTFVNAFAAGGGWFIDAFQVSKLLTVKGNTVGVGDWAVSQWSTAMAVIAGVLAAIITLIVVSIMLAVLVARIVMLWIYTIFSPLVFLGFAFPPLQKHTGKIWEDFIKQLVVGPVLAFFIWLALTTASPSGDMLAKQSLISGVSPTENNEVCVGAGAFFCTGQGGNAGSFQKFIIVIGLLIGGLMVAQQMGGAAGSIAGKGLQWAKGVAGSPAIPFIKGGKRLGTYMEMKMSQGWGEKGRFKMPIFNRGWWQGLPNRGDEERKRAQILAAGKGAQMAEEHLHPKFWKKRKGARDLEEEHEMQVLNEYISENRKAMGAAANPRQELKNIMKRASEAEGMDGDLQRQAAMIMAAEQGNLDDTYGSVISHFIRKVDAGSSMTDEDFEKKYGIEKKQVGDTITEEQFKKKFGMDMKRAKNMDANAQRRFQLGYLNVDQKWADATEIDLKADEFKGLTPEQQKEKVKEKTINSQTAVKELLKISGHTEQAKLRTIAVASEVAKEVGHWEQLTTIKDDKTGKFMMMPEMDRLAEVLGEMAKRPTREVIQRTATHVFRPSTVDETTGEFDRSANFDQMGLFETTMSGAWKGQVLGDIHQSPMRTSEHYAGTYFDATGELKSDPEELKKLGFENQNQLRESMEQMRSLNPQLFDALYINKYYGRKPGPAYADRDKWKPIVTS